jgi:hypothetical protein
MPKARLPLPVPLPQDGWQDVLLDSRAIVLHNIIQEARCSYVRLPFEPEQALTGGVDDEDLAFG